MIDAIPSLKEPIAGIMEHLNYFGDTFIPKNNEQAASLIDIEAKRYIIGSIFPEKWTILENKGRTGKVNLAEQLIYQINSLLSHKKSRS